MKKVVLFSLACVAINLASCSKAARTCHCTGTDTDHQVVKTTAGAAVSETTTVSSRDYTKVLTSATKKTAKFDGECISRTTTFTESYTGGGNVTTDDITEELTCTVK